jgi:hypothetical protein
MTSAEAINTLAAKVCQCGQPKVRRTALSGACFAQLPGPIQRGLWHKIGRGFEAGYERAMEFLRTGK